MLFYGMERRLAACLPVLGMIASPFLHYNGVQELLNLSISLLNRALKTSYTSSFFLSMLYDSITDRKQIPSPKIQAELE
jgi:hypothetical protein